MELEEAKRSGPNERNPPWSRDELILALDLYMRARTSPLGKGSVEIANLSELLNRIHRLMVPLGVRADFRNPNGVYMKLMNYRRFDPSYTAAGRVGLTRGNRDEERVWAEYADDPARLSQVASAIRAVVLTNKLQLTAPGEEDGQFDAPEGRMLTGWHRYRERNQRIVRDRKALSLRQHGHLRCEACSFDFGERYGARGEGFIECHHTRPVHTLRDGGRTRLADLALLCANCHRIVHAAPEWLSVDELRALIRSRDDQRPTPLQPPDS